MRYLLDTHILLGWLADNKKLQEKTMELIKNPDNQIFISVASAWEMSIKSKIGKLSLGTSIQDCFESSGFLVLDIVLNHVLELDKLPPYHQDPFNRILIAQAKVEGLILVSDDIKIKKYDLRIA